VRQEEAGGGPPPPPALTIETVEPPEAPAVIPERVATRKWLAFAMTGIVIGLFLCLAFRYLWFGDSDDRRDFIHLFEILLTVYGTILGFYFGSQD